VKQESVWKSKSRA